MKLVYILALICLAKFSFSQTVNPPSISFDSSKVIFGFNAFQDIQSSSLRNEFSRILLKGGNLTDEIKGNSLSKQKDINRFGRILDGEFYFANFNFKPFKSKNLAFFSEIGYQSTLSGIYSKDLFQLGFYGNENYIGDTAQFSGTEFQFIDLQNFGIGLIDGKTKSYFTLNLINVQNYLSSRIQTGYFTETADSSEFDFRLKGQSQNSYNSNFNKGLGFAVNACVNLELPWLKDKSAFFQLKIKNLGFAKVNYLNQYSIDTNIHFNGFQFSDFLNTQNGSFENVNWLDTLNLKTDTVSAFILLPSKIEFGKVLNSNFERKIQSFFGIRIYPTLNYTPKIYAGIDYKIVDKLHLGASVSFGGFGLFRTGIYANYQTKKINFGLGCDDIYGLISKNGFGQMINLRFACTL